MLLKSGLMPSPVWAACSSFIYLGICLAKRHLEGFIKGDLLHRVQCLGRRKSVGWCKSWKELSGRETALRGCSAGAANTATSNATKPPARPPA